MRGFSEVVYAVLPAWGKSLARVEPGAGNDLGKRTLHGLFSRSWKAIHAALDGRGGG